MQQAPGPDPVAAPREPLPRRLGPEDIGADEVLAELAGRLGDRRHQVGSGIDDVAEALDAARGIEAGEHVPVGVDHPAPGLVRVLYRDAEQVDGDARDLGRFHPTRLHRDDRAHDSCVGRGSERAPAEGLTNCASSDWESQTVASQDSRAGTGSRLPRSSRDGQVSTGNSRDGAAA